MDKIDVIIPVYQPDKSLFALVERLCRQTVPVNRIILMNTEQKYYDRLTYGGGFSEEYRQKISVTHLSKREFDHGGTRNRAVGKSDADIFVLLTQDAMPADEHLIERLVCALEKNNAAVAYARQLPADTCGPIEAYTRGFNYPDTSAVKTKKDISRLGIKTFFCSNVCAAYKRDVFDKLGGFVSRTIFNEDMIYAAGAIEAGYAVVYEAEAMVVHSHNYSNKQQLQRNFDMGVSQADHPEIFKRVTAESEGKKMVWAVTLHLRKSHRMRLLPHFYMQCACRYLGYWLGRHYSMLPNKIILLCTSNKAYWSRI